MSEYDESVAESVAETAASYVKRLAALVLGAFVGAFLSYLSLDPVFNILTFNWQTALVGSASMAFLALVKGLAAKRFGDPETPYFTR